MKKNNESYEIEQYMSSEKYIEIENSLGKKIAKDITRKILNCDRIENRNMYFNFLFDFSTAIASKDKSIVDNFLIKYQISTNNLIPSAKEAKLYVYSFGDKYKLLTPSATNFGKSLVDLILSVTNNLKLQRNGMSKKSLTPIKILRPIFNSNFVCVDTINDGIKFDDKIILYDANNNVKNNKINIVKKLASGRFFILYGNCQSKRKENIEKIIKSITDKIHCDNITLMFDIKFENILKYKLQELLKINDTKDIDTKIEELMMEFDLNPITTFTSADLAETCTILKELMHGHDIYIPIIENNKTSDLISIFKHKKNYDINIISVKKNAGGASASRSKIENSEFNNPLEKEELLRVDGLYDLYFNSKDPNSLVEAISIKQSIISKNIEYLLNNEKYLKKEKNIENRVQSLINGKRIAIAIKPHMIEYFSSLNLIEALYNKNVKAQYWITEKYETNKKTNKCTTYRTDGLNVLAYMSAAEDVGFRNNRPSNRNSTREIIRKQNDR